MKSDSRDYCRFDPMMAEDLQALAPIGPGDPKYLRCWFNIDHRVASLIPNSTMSFAERLHRSVMFCMEQAYLQESYLQEYYRER